MRRLGILLGVSGGILGGFLGYNDALNLWHIRAAHGRFEALMASATMQKVAKAARDEKKTGKKYRIETDKGTYEVETDEPSGALISVNLDGIKDVTVDKTGLVSGIELSTGVSVPRTEAPDLKAYLIPLFYPIVGFLAPWGVIRLLTWVGSGFFEPAR